MLVQLQFTTDIILSFHSHVCCNLFGLNLASEKRSEKNRFKWVQCENANVHAFGTFVFWLWQKRKKISKFICFHCFKQRFVFVYWQRKIARDAHTRVNSFIFWSFCSSLCAYKCSSLWGRLHVNRTSSIRFGWTHEPRIEVPIFCLSFFSLFHFLIKYKCKVYFEREKYF